MSDLFKLPPEMLLLLQCLEYMDISRMNVAVSAKGARAPFLQMIASRQITSNSEDTILGYEHTVSSTQRKKGCMKWISLRGIHFNAICSWEGMETLVQPEQLVTLNDSHASVRDPAKTYCKQL